MWTWFTCYLLEVLRHSAAYAVADTATTDIYA